MTQRTNWSVFRNASSVYLGPAIGGVSWQQAIEDLFPNEHVNVSKASAGGYSRRVADVCIVPVEDSSVYSFIEKQETAPADGSNGMTVQSLLFPTDKWTAEQASAWIDQHDDFEDYGMDETDQYLRFRQADPGRFADGSLRTIDLGGDIRAIVGRPKSEKGVDAEIAATNDRLVFEGIQLLKAEDDSGEERYVLSVVMEPNDGDDGAPLDPDAEGDIQSAQEIRKAAHRWMEHGGQVDLNHSWQALGAQRVRVLESYLSPCDVEIGGYTVRKGTWLLGLRIADDALWTAVKAGDIGAYSIGGSGQRSPVEEPDA